MGSYLPSTWFVAVVFPLASVGIVAGLFLLYTKDNNASATPEAALAVDTVNAVQNQASETDTDNDGLKDWEESLWRTDAHKADTDGDGTNDGTEVVQNRNPTRPGPNDALPRMDREAFTSEVVSDGAGGTTTLTITQAVGRELFASYLTLKQSGQFNKENQDKMIRAIAEGVQRRAAPKLEYLMNLNISTENGIESLRKYRDTFAAAVGPLLSTSTMPAAELYLLGNRVEKPDDPTAAKQFTDMLDLYAKAIQTLRSMSVPASVSQLHLAFLNGMITYADILDGTGNLRADPVRAYATVGSYEKSYAQFKQSGQALQQFFISHGLERI